MDIRSCFSLQFLLKFGQDTSLALVSSSISSDFRAKELELCHVVLHKFFSDFKENNLQILIFFLYFCDERNILIIIIPIFFCF